MQPTYQVPWERLESACAKLRQGVAGDDSAKKLLPLLFLCGLHFQHSYYAAGQTGRAEAKQAGAGHLIDDGLDQACERGLKTLMRLSKSRGNFVNDEAFKPCLNKEWTALNLAFLDLFKELPVTVQRWIEHGDKATNLIRFSFGMGVRSHWFDAPFFASMMRKPFGFANWKGEPCTKQVKEVLDSFTWNPEWVLPEI